MMSQYISAKIKIGNVVEKGTRSVDRVCRLLDEQGCIRVFFFFSAGFSKKQDGRLGVRYAYLAFEVFDYLAESAGEAPYT
jgi:hypothetical protein